MLMVAIPPNRLVFVDVVLVVELVHSPDIDRDQQYKGIDRALLSEPEAELETEKAELIEKISQQDAEAEGYGEPDGEQDQHQAEVFFPVSRLRLFGFEHRHVGCPLHENQRAITRSIINASV